MQPQSDGKVWISREEYERLRQAEQSQPLPQSPVGTPTPFVSSTNTLETIQRQELIIGSILGIGFVLSLCVSNLRWLAVLIVIIFCAFALVSFMQYREAKMRIARGQTPRQPRSTTKILLTIGATLLIAPTVAFIALIVFLIVVLSVSGGAGAGS
jgi:hypothetical protein